MSISFVCLFLRVYVFRLLSPIPACFSVHVCLFCLFSLLVSVCLFFLFVSFALYTCVSPCQSVSVRLIFTDCLLSLSVHLSVLLSSVFFLNTLICLSFSHSVNVCDCLSVSPCVYMFSHCLCILIDVN